jgi:pullulanase/glycogen debranching enzyme
VRTLRERQKRNLLATLLLSQGVPMIRGGDERDTAEALTTRRLYRTGQRFQVRPRSLVVLRLVPR